ncbi:MAG: sulfite exporter TauE/SafE family protein [Candidatus Theseobacter exili]|nr:sulfite exporter TauE/SafE family protein [Candidatus Theseobacter exili]
MNPVFLSLFVGLSAGVVSGLLGVGGGVIMVPALVFLFGMTQRMANGTTLATMIPPIGLLAAWTYYREGNVNIQIALWICLGFFVGGYFGARAAHFIPQIYLRRIFGCLMLLVSLKMIFGK